MELHKAKFNMVFLQLPTGSAHKGMKFSFAADVIVSGLLSLEIWRISNINKTSRKLRDMCCINYSIPFRNAKFSFEELFFFVLKYYGHQIN